MIGYRFTESELHARIEESDREKKRKEPWLERAAKLTRSLRKNPALAIASEWKAVKSVYVKLQHGKCAFCEQVLGKSELTARNIDVEHFRPKNAVKAWPSAKLRKELRLSDDLPVSSGSGSGYRFLAYHPLNYAASCRTCNQSLKKCFFPIARKHAWKGTDPRMLQKSEQPYLIYPLGDFDEDPEELIAFEGYMVVPTSPPTSGYRHQRARVTIAFFQLSTREDELLLPRAKQLDDVLSKLENHLHAKTKAKQAESWDDILRMAGPANAHAGCVRSFLRLYGDPEAQSAPPTRARALENLELARAYWRSKRPAWRAPKRG